MPNLFFLEQYRQKAAVLDTLVQSGRGKEFKLVEFLEVVRDMVALLELKPEHDLLDVGCANGMLDIVFSACCRSLLALEPVPELLAHASENLSAYPNVRLAQGDATAIPADQASFDRVLMLGVVQLIPPSEIRAAFREMHRVTRPAGRIVIASVPDRARRDEFLEPYLAGVRAAAHLTDEQKHEIIERNRQAMWSDPDELGRWWQELGAEVQILPSRLSKGRDDQRFHLVVRVGDLGLKTPTT